MRASLLLLPLLLILSACQSTQLQRDFDPSRDFAAYRSWSWQEPAVQYKPDDPRLKSDLTDQRIRTAISQQLDQRGLRPAAANAPGDLKVQVWMIVDNRQQQVPGVIPGVAVSGAAQVTWKPAPWTIRLAPCRSTCTTARTANWSGAVALNRCCATHIPVRANAKPRFAAAWRTC